MSQEPIHPTVMTPSAGQAVTRNFGGEELAVSAETAATAVAAQQRAMVEARFVMALRKPRDIDDVRAKMKRAVERPGFAASAWYLKPVGKGVQGFSIRFAEEAIRALTNILVECPITWDDPRKRVVMVCVTDLENNVGFPTAVVIEKTVERSYLKEGQTAIGVRMNSKNQATYLVEATEDEIAAKQNALVSKTIRNEVLRLLPGDIQDECKARILAIRQGAAATDPDGERKRIADAFAELNVTPSILKTYLGHDLGTASPAELVDLRALYTAIKSGETTWAEALEERVGQVAAEPAKKTGLDGVADDLEKKAAAAATATPGPSDAPAGQPACPDHPTQTIENGDGSRACFACKWTAPAPAPKERVPGEDDGEPGPVEAVKAVAAAAGDPTKAPAKGQRRLEER